VVFDNLNRGDGIGSRFFEIQNALPVTASRPASAQSPAPLLRAAAVRRSRAPVLDQPAFRSGYDPGSALVSLRRGGDGRFDAIELNELDRLEIHLPPGTGWQAALRFGEERRALPIGSTFDAESGVFYWQLGPGFLGRFELEFTSDGMAPLAIPVDVITRR
jgi:hypothetical protein